MQPCVDTAYLLFLTTMTVYQLNLWTPRALLKKVRGHEKSWMTSPYIIFTKYEAALYHHYYQIWGNNDCIWYASAAVPVDTMLVYNISADTWMMSNATLSSPRSDLCVAAVDGVLYGAGDTLKGKAWNLYLTLCWLCARVYHRRSDVWVGIILISPCVAFTIPLETAALGYSLPTVLEVSWLCTK